MTAGERTAGERATGGAGSDLAVDIAPSDPVGPPRLNGELVFEAPWQGRAFGICMAVLQREQLGWDAFRRHLVAAIEASPQVPYYDSFGVALDAFFAERSITPAAP
ncbi:MAG: hypothetical protein ACR2H3_11745, partial [Acidimicrobiales bacterium]